MLVELHENSRIKIENSYFKEGFPGARSTVYTRPEISDMLEKASALLPESYSFLIFDCYRSVETQLFLFDLFYDKIKKDNPNDDHETLVIKTKNFVVHPDEFEEKGIPPHCSGSAVDLTIISENGPLDMGTEFDDATELAGTDYFVQDPVADSTISEKRWLEIRANRKLLTKIMLEVGFTGFSEEWWHFDFGNWRWASITGKDEIYGLVEP